MNSNVGFKRYDLSNGGTVMREEEVDKQRLQEERNHTNSNDIISNKNNVNDTILLTHRHFLLDYHPILLEGPGPSDERDAETVASIVLYNINRHFTMKPRVNEKPLLLITQGDPISPNGIAAISRIVARELKVDRCLIYLDEEIDPAHYANADKENIKYQIKYTEIKAMMMDVSMRDYNLVCDSVVDKIIKYHSHAWVQKYALLQELTKATMKKICGYVTVVHTVADPMKNNVTKFFTVGVDLGIIDKEVDMVQYSCQLFDLLSEKKFDDVSTFLSGNNTKVKKANVLYVDSQYGNTSLHLAAFLQAPKSILELIFDIGGGDLYIQTKNKWEATPLIDACDQRKPDIETINYLLEKAKEKLPNNDFLSFVRHQRKDGFNALHSCCSENKPQLGSNEVIRTLVEHGGIELCMSRDKNNMTPLGLLYSNQRENAEDIEFLSKKWYHSDPKLRSVPFTILDSANAADYEVSRDIFLQKFMNKIYVMRTYIFIVMLDFYAALAMLWCLSFGLMDLVTNKENETILRIVIGLVVCSLSWMVFRESMQIWTTPFFLDYFSTPTTYIDLAQIIFAMITLSIIWSYDEGPLSEESQNYLMFATAIAWLRIIFVTGQLSYEISVFSSALVKIVLKLVPFLIITAVLLAGFAHISFIAETQKSIQVSEDGPKTFNDGIILFYVTNLLTFLSAEFEFDDPKDLEYDRIFVVRLFFAFIIGILLLNILIAVISNQFTEVMVNSRKAFWKNRLKYLVEVTSTLDGMSNFARMLWPRRKKNPEEEKSPGESKEVLTTAVSKLVYDDRVERFDFLEPVFVGMKGTVFEEKFKERQDLPDKYNCLVKVTSWFWKHWEINERPSFRERIFTFLAFSTLDQITFPGKAAIHMILGLKIDEETDNCIGKSLWAICYAMRLVGAIIMYPLGALTAGLAWPDVFRQGFFARTEEANNSELEQMMEMSRKQHELYQAQIDQLRADLQKLSTSKKAGWY